MRVGHVMRMIKWPRECDPDTFLYSFVFRLSTLAAVAPAVVRPPSEARGAEAWDRAWTSLRRIRMYDTMLSGYSMLSTTSHTLERLPCASVDGRDMRSSVPQKASKMT